MISINLLRISPDSKYLEFSVECPLGYVFDTLDIKKYDYNPNPEQIGLPLDNGWRDCSHLYEKGDLQKQVMRISIEALSKEFNNDTVLSATQLAAGQLASTMFYVKFGVTQTEPNLVAGDNYDGYTIAYIFPEGHNGFVDGKIKGFLISDIFSGTWYDAITKSADIGNGWRLPNREDCDSVVVNYLAEEDLYWTSSSVNSSTAIYIEKNEEFEIIEGIGSKTSNSSYFLIKDFIYEALPAIEDVIAVASDLNNMYILLKDSILNLDIACLSDNDYNNLIRNYLFIYAHIEALRLERFSDAEMYYNLIKKNMAFCNSNIRNTRILNTCNCG